MQKKIITTFEYPPIPVRNFDWVAQYEGQEESGWYGHGETKEDAIAMLESDYPAINCDICGDWHYAENTPLVCATGDGE